ncbi:toll-like receptor 2 [Anolis carolinensis]|uniref:toll-like receptor 2 n=1 Tax=Anolis carolinensis TaxID=28377 RepID=UPI002F2B754B
MPCAWGSRVPLLVLLLLLVPHSSRAPVPSGCHVPSAGRASCRGQNLIRVPPDLPETLEALDLSYNKIRRISAGDFAALTRLKSLDLRYNDLSYVDDDAFASNLLLEQLDLFNNSLLTIPSNALKDLKRLKVLSMSNNLYPRSALDGVFGGLKDLEELSMGGPAILTVGSEDFQPLADIPLKKFALKTASSLTEYQPGAFATLTTESLWCDIALDRNPGALPRMLRDLWGKPLRYLRFRNLFEFTYYNHPADIFSNLERVDARELVFFRGKFNENLLRLILLNVQKTTVQDLSFISIDFARSPQRAKPDVGIANLTLRSLVLKDISNPDILRFDWTFTWFSGVSFLSVLNVNFNFVPCDAWKEMRNVAALNISNNRLLDEYIYNELCSYVDIVPKLEEFNVSYNRVTRLRTVSRLTAAWPRLSVLDLSHNQIGNDDNSPCRWSPTLVWLGLAYNAVTTMEIFRCLPVTLRFLDLSHSQLERLELSYFEAAVDLRELRLSGNKLKFIPTAWKGPSLEVLTVDGNSFGAIGRGSFANMPRLSRLQAGNNPYHCVCELHSFLREALSKGKLTITDWPENWTCYHPERLLDTPVADYAPWVTECDVTVVVAITVSVTAAVVGAATLLCWRFDVPWYLRATFRIVRSKYRSGHPSGQPSRRFTYHAFVSYSHSDADWVRKELLLRLEATRPPYRLCVHERDFTPGRWVIDNIVDSIERSRKVVFVLSRSFVDSDWCNYELYFAHQRAVGLGFEDVVLVVKEAVDPQALPRKFCKLRKLLSAKTYLEWPAEPGRQAFFWAQLAAVLGKAEKGVQRPEGEAAAGQTPEGQPGGGGSSAVDAPAS